MHRAFAGVVYEDVDGRFAVRSTRLRQTLKRVEQALAGEAAEHRLRSALAAVSESPCGQLIRPSRWR